MSQTGPVPDERPARTEAARKVAAMVALGMRGDLAGRNDALGQIKDSGELTTGYHVIVETLALELGRLTDRTPADVVSSVAVLASALPDPPPTT